MSATATQVAAADATGKTSLIRKIAARYSVEADGLMKTLKATAFRTDQEITTEQMMMLLVVADQYELNPFTKELFAFPDKKNGIVPVVSVDGWARIINSHPMFDNFDFRYAEDMVVSSANEHKPCHEWVECVMYRKDRNHPTVVREYFDEVYRPPFKGERNGRPFTVNGPWQTHTKRMMRHKALIQTARLAFGFAGIYDEDEAHRILEATVVSTQHNASQQQPERRTAQSALDHFSSAPPIQQTYTESDQEAEVVSVTLHEKKEPTSAETDNPDS